MIAAGYAFGFAIGATSAIRFRFYREFLDRRGRPWRGGSLGRQPLILNEGRTKRGSNSPPTGQRPDPPPGPPQPLTADLIRYSRWTNEQVERAMRNKPPTENPSQHP